MMTADIADCQVCNKSEQEIIDRGSKKSQRLHEYLMKQAVSLNGAEETSSVDDSEDVGLRNAIEHRDRLLDYDKTRSVVKCATFGLM